jgi:nucleoside-diphosphate-sugar epimerase
MTNKIHTVLGASGAIGKAVIQELQNRSLNIRAVMRSQKLEGIETVEADLLDSDQAINSIVGSSYVYFCVGLPYRTDIWLKNFPLMMQNVIDACSQTDATLIFLDNVYMYGPAPLQIPFDENHPQQASAKKGIARKITADLLLKAIENKQVNAVIGRAADFYGPNASNSSWYISFLEKMLANKAPQSIAKPGVKHTYAYTADIGRALVELALTPATHGQVYHLPVGAPITIEEVTDIFNKVLGTDYKMSFMPPLMRKILSIFIPILKEAGEMLYQSDTVYEMSFDKFQKQFPDFKVKPYEQGIKEMVNAFKADPDVKSNL